MWAIEDEIAQERGPARVLDEPNRVGLGVAAGTHVEDGVGHAIELQPLARLHNGVRVRPLLHPLGTVDRRPLLSFRLLEPTHQVENRLRRDNLRRVLRDEVRDPGDMIRVRMRDEDREQRLLQSLKLFPEPLALAFRQRGIDGDDAGAGLDEVRVDEDAALPAGVRVDRYVFRELYSLHGAPLDEEDPPAEQRCPIDLSSWLYS